VIRRGFENGCTKKICVYKSRLRAQKMISIISSIVNTIGGDLHDHLTSTMIFDPIMNKILIQVLKP
jgi:hypothetical protein